MSKIVFMKQNWTRNVIEIVKMKQIVGKIMEKKEEEE